VTAQITCPLCLSEKNSKFHQDEFRDYYQCINCSFVFVPFKYHLSASEEKERYDSHNNNPKDPRYRHFLSQLTEPLNGLISNASIGLDFGCGPGPTLSLMLEEQGHCVELFDKYYANDHSVFDKEFDFITLTEVIEHLYDPIYELERLASILKPKGVLAIMTQTITKDVDFKTWYYKNDPSHISFFSQKSLEFLASHLELRMKQHSERVIFFKKLSKD
jgi:SAM-dependent methyltransferase